MKMTNTKLPPPLSDVLYAFALADGSPSADLLNQYIYLYPEYAAELASLAVELAVSNGSRDETEKDVQKTEEVMQSAKVLKMISQFQNRLHEVRKSDRNPTKADRKETPEENPFASLSRAEIKAFSGTLRANGVFFMKLRDCQIRLDTMSDGFIEKTAELLKTSAPLLRRFFSGGVRLAYSANYKSEKKPEVGAKETFQEAVRNSGLTKEQQEYLLKL